MADYFYGFTHAVLLGAWKYCRSGTLGTDVVGAARYMDVLEQVVDLEDENNQ